jgi:hypothetical protein
MDEHEGRRLLECLELVLQQMGRQELRLERLAIAIQQQNREQISLLRQLLAQQRHYPRPTGVRVMVS